MKWNLRRKAADVEIWKSAELRRTLADAGLEVSAGKMSYWWSGTPRTVRLDELEILCVVLKCSPTDLMTPEPANVTIRPRGEKVANGGDNDGASDGAGGESWRVTPRLGVPRGKPPL